MARRKYRSLNVEDLKDMSMPELKKEARRIFNTANKRAERLQKAEDIYFTPALQGMKESGGRFTMGGKQKLQLIKEIKRAQTFMEAETSSVSGARKFYENLRKGLAEAGVDTEGSSNWELGNLLEAYQKAKETNPHVGNAEWKYLIMDQITEIQTKTGNKATPTEMANMIIQSLESKAGERNTYENNVPTDIGDDFIPFQFRPDLLR